MKERNASVGEGGESIKGFRMDGITDPIVIATPHKNHPQSYDQRMPRHLRIMSRSL